MWGEKVEFLLFPQYFQKASFPGSSKLPAFRGNGLIHQSDKKEDGSMIGGERRMHFVTMISMTLQEEIDQAQDCNN